MAQVWFNVNLWNEFVKFESRTIHMDVIQHTGDPQVGNLATPLNASNLSKSFIGNLPVYRDGLTPFKRGLEIGMAHGYLVFGPFALLGPLRNSNLGNVAGLLSAVGLIVILTVALSAYGQARSDQPLSSVTVPNPPKELGTKEGWDQFSRAFLIGGAGGAFFAFILWLTPLNYLLPKIIGL